MGASDPEDEVRVPVRRKKTPHNPARRRHGRLPGRKSGTGARPAKGDMLIEAMGLGNEDLDKPVILLQSGSESMARFFPGTPDKSLELIGIAGEVLQTYQDGGGDPHADLIEIMQFLKVSATVPHKVKKFLPVRHKNLFADDRAHLTGAALLLLLSWVQRKRHQMLSILMDFQAETDERGTKMKRLQQALEEFLIGTESLQDNSKKSKKREL